MKNKSVIALLSVLVIVLAFFGYMLSNKKLVNPMDNYKTEVGKIETVSKDSDNESIQKDLDETDLTTLDAEVTSIEAELNSSN